MRNMSRFWMVLVVGITLGVTLSWVSPAKAAPLTTVDYATFSSWLGPVIGPPMISSFDFVPTNQTFPGPDGQVLSVVYEGTGAVAGLNVYVYQIMHFSSPPSGEGKIEGMSFDLLGPWAVPGVLDPGTVAFQVDPGDPPVYEGHKAFSDATITPPLPGIPASMSFSMPSPFLPTGKNSWLVGFFSPMPPTTVVADVRDTDATILSPTVYTPSPEPSVFILFGMGLLGGVWWRRRMK